MGGVPVTVSRIVVLDPGKTTGVVDWKTTEDGSVVTGVEMQFQPLCRYLLTDVATSRPGTVIVAESFIITSATAKNTQAPWSLEVIGVARMVSELYCGRDLRLQQAASAKRFSSDARLKRLGWWTPGKGHANDAARHLLLYVATHGLLPNSILEEFASMP